VDAERAILEQWVARTIESYPEEAVPFLTGNKDPFRNPVGHTLRESLALLWRELLGEMDKSAIFSALDAIIRLRAVQNFTPSDAVRFVFELKPLARNIRLAGGEPLDDRIDELALLAFDQYMKCREQVAELRAKEQEGAFRMRHTAR
jgi:hypothetical protein